MVTSQIEGGPRVTRATPVIMVSDLSASRGYYTRRLGFTVEWGGEDGAIMSGMSRGAAHIMVFQGAPWFAGSRPWSWVCFDVEAVDELYEELVGRGARIKQPPANFPWQYEMIAEDLDGNILVFGTEPRYDQPYEETPSG